MTAIIDMIRPTTVPIAKSNQKTSVGPSIKNGISPRTVDRTVSKIGVIFCLNAERYALMSITFRCFMVVFLDA